MAANLAPLVDYARSLVGPAADVTFSGDQFVLIETVGAVTRATPLGDSEAKARKTLGWYAAAVGAFAPVRLVECRQCDGTGQTPDYFCDDRGLCLVGFSPCSHCDGAGEVEPAPAPWEFYGPLRLDTTEEVPF